MADVRRPRDRVQSAVIRAWAKDNGWPDIADRGRLPPEVRAAFEEAHGEPVDPVDDVSAPDESDLDDTDVAADDEYGDTGQPFVFMPPPADLDEARERAGRDPDPAHLIRGRGRNRDRATRTRDDTKPPAPRVTKAVREDIEGKLAFWLSIPAEPWLRVDPYCGQAYSDNIEQIALKMAPLVCQSPDLVRWFSKSSTFIMWTELGIAVRPVVEAIIAHHVTKRISLNEQGQAIEQPRGGMDFSAYSARQPNPAAA